MNSPTRDGSELSRRDVLKQFGALGLAGSAGTIAGGIVLARPTTAHAATSTTSTTSTSTKVTTNTAKPLHIRLRAEATKATIRPGVVSPVWSYRATVVSGDPSAVVPSTSYLGPTLRFRRGQRVKVTFENRLPQHSIVHWHGLDLPQRQDGQPADAVDPGKNYEYDFVVDNEPGTYWYHPHPHMHTAEQVYRGLAGMIHVVGDEPGMPTNELSLVIQDRTIAADGTLTYTSMHHDMIMGFVGATPVVNGVTDYSAKVRRQPYRVRILNGSNSQTQRLTLSNGATFHVLATDGNRLERPVATRQLVITPAQRLDVWIDFAAIADGSKVELRSADLFTTGGPLGDLDAAATTIASFTGEGPARPGKVPTSLGKQTVPSIDEANNAASPKQFVLSTRRAAHWINDTTWDERNVSSLETVKAGSTEVWEFINRSPMPHPMHIHGKAFRVIGRSWESDALAAEWSRIASGVVETGLRDTVLVWPGQRVRIVVPFTKHRGFFLYHCHVLEHEDMGMMRSFRVV